LKAKPWFRKDGWQISTHPFPRSSPSGITFHVFKKHWFNEESGGIHIESHVDLNPAKQKNSYLTVHLLHNATIPGTKIKRIALSKPVIDAALGVVSQWPGYKVRAGKYGQQPFTLTMDGASDTFETELEREVSRLCKMFGPLIDQTLARLLLSCTP
ncbi:MAG: hypothetical protein ACXVA8_13305, partial [Bdellovibrionota bacterium]